MRIAWKWFVVVLFISASLCFAQDNIVYLTTGEANNLPGQDFFPLAKGNTSWLYYMGRWYDEFGQIQTETRLYKYQVLDTITVSNRLYYKINQDGSIYYLRKDQTNNKVYRNETLNPNNEILFMDFTLANNTSYIQGNNIVTAYSSGFNRGFTRDDGTYFYVSNHIGFGNIGGIFGHVDVLTRFIEASVKSGNTIYAIYDPYQAPEFIAQSMPGTISTNKWHIKFNYDRVFSSLFDSITIYSYYEKGNDSIPGVPVRFRTTQINTTLTLDSALLAQNYRYNYRIEYKDNFIVPIRFYYPAEGYGSLNYVSGIAGDDLKGMDYSLGQNYPNPFNPATTIEYYIPSESKVNITVYNTLGSKIKELYDGSRVQGNYGVKFDGAGLSSGVYFVIIKASSIDGKKSFVDSKKMILMK